MDGKQRPGTAGGKKPYSSPELVEYGNLTTLTMAKGGTKQDGGAKPSTRSTGRPA